MELSIATARALQAEALNFGAENGNVVFMYEQFFWSYMKTSDNFSGRSRTIRAHVVALGRFVVPAVPFASSSWFAS